MTEKNKKPIFKKWWFWVIVAVLAIGAFGGTGKDKSDTAVATVQKEQTVGKPDKTVEEVKKSEQPKKAEPKEKYAVSDDKIEADGMIRYVTGKVKNNSGKKAGYVQVEINLYDKDGVQLGSTLANANNLEPDAVWAFKAIVTDEKAASYKIMKVTGF